MQVIAAFNAQELSKLCDYFAISGAIHEKLCIFAMLMV